MSEYMLIALEGRAECRRHARTAWRDGGPARRVECCSRKWRRTHRERAGFSCVSCGGADSGRDMHKTRAAAYLENGFGLIA